MGFLDLFDSPDIMGSILGINPGGAMGAPQPGAGMAPPPPNMGSPANGGMFGEVLDRPQAPARGYAGPGGPVLPPGTNTVGAGPMEPDTGLNTPDRQPAPTGGLYAPSAPGAPGAAMAAPAPAPPPLPMAPGNVAAVAGGGGPVIRPPGGGFAGPGGATIPTSTGPATPPPPGSALAGIIPPLPPGTALAGGPPTTTGRGLEAALGLGYEGRQITPANPFNSGTYGMEGKTDPRIGNAVMAGLAGLGKGLTNVGNLRPGTPKGQAFAAGAGGGLEGGMQQLALQQHQEHQAKMDAFMMSSTAFKDWLGARHADNEDAATESRGEYWRAKAKQMGVVGATKGSLQTPEQKVAFIENEAVRMHDQFRKSQESLAKSRGKDVDTDKVERDTEAFRKRLYKHFNIDPDKAEKIATRGLDEDNPFPTKGITTEEQFHQQIPNGAFYDTGKKFDADGNYTYTYTKEDGSTATGVHHGKPNAPVILQKMPSLPAAPAAPAASGGGLTADDYDFLTSGADLG